MAIITTAEGWLFLLRWIHFLAGITWIGMLYYFNFVQTPFFGSELGGTARGAMVRGLVPNALWWFRWGAMFTFLSGWTIVLWRLHQGIPIGDPYMTKILTGGLLGTFMWANVWFVIWPAQQVVIRSAEQVAGVASRSPRPLHAAHEPGWRRAPTRSSRSRCSSSWARRATSAARSRAAITTASTRCC